MKTALKPKNTSEYSGCWAKVIVKTPRNLWLLYEVTANGKYRRPDCGKLFGTSG